MLSGIGAKQLRFFFLLFHYQRINVENCLNLFSKIGGQKYKVFEGI